MHPADGARPRGVINSRFSMAWFGVGLGLTTATQLRLQGMPLGAGETMLAAWAGFAACALLLRPRVADGPLLRRLVWFWLVGALAMAAGACVALLAYREPRNGSLVHDSMAFAFVASVLLLFVAPPGLPERVRRVMSVAIPLVVLPQAVLAPAPFVGIPTRPVIPWTGIRYRGWAENPNQLALALVVVPFVGWALARAQPTRLRRAALYASTVLSLLLGVVCSSDALFAAWLAGGGLMGAVAWVRLARRPRPTLWSLGTAYAIIPLLLLAGALTAGPPLAAVLDARAVATYNQGDQGSTRMGLWLHGVQAWSSSPLVGLGPGTHSGYLGPFHDEEAHNTFVDWSASTGLVGLAAYLALLAAVGGRLLRGARPVLVAAFVGLVGYSVFHYVLRQPVYWMGLVTLVVLADSARTRGPAARSA